MELKRELFLGVGAVIATVVLTAFGAIGLLRRMGPSIQEIRQQHVVALESVQTMLIVLAETPSAAGRRRFQLALDQARNTVTEPGEQEPIRNLAASWEDALTGDPEARERTISALSRLSQLNVEAMHGADRELRRLGVAGVWSAVFLGFLGFTVGLLAVSRLRRRVLEPLMEIHDVLSAPRSQEMGRRCATINAPGEVLQIQRAVNELLDWRHGAFSLDKPPIDRELTRYLMNRVPQPAAAFDENGALVFVNDRALELLQRPDGPALRQALRRALSKAGETEPDSSETAPVKEMVSLGESRGFFLVLEDDQGRTPQAPPP